MFDISFSEFFFSERPDSVSTHCNCATLTACTKSDIRTWFSRRRDWCTRSPTRRERRGRQELADLQVPAPTGETWTWDIPTWDWRWAACTNWSMEYASSDWIRHQIPEPNMPHILFPCRETSKRVDKSCLTGAKEPLNSCTSSWLRDPAAAN